ncbi:MAG: LamG-like jellyroll fold domain-containing protein [Janthinobacterium lividum]
MQNTITTLFTPKLLQRLGGLALLMAMAGAAQAQTNNALSFDGSNDYVDLGTASAGRPSGNADFTYESWYYNSGGQTGDRWMAWFGTANTNTAAIIGYDGATGKVKFNHYAANNDLTSNVVLPTGRWSHLAVVWRGAALQADIYLNGTLAQTLQYTQALAIPTSSSFQLGTFVSSTSYCVSGRLDEVRLYTTALTAANIQADMFSTTASVPASQVAYYNFDQGTANGTNTGVNTLTNQVGSTNSGSLLNFALAGNSSNWVRSFPTITGISPTSGPQGASVSISGTNLLDATSLVFNGAAASSFTISSDNLATATVPATATTGPVGLASATLAKYNGPSFSFVTDLVVSTSTSIAAGTYNSITINSGGVATLAGNVSVTGSIIVNSGGTLNDGCSVISGAGSFTLAAGGTLGICNAAGIASSGATGAVQTTGTRSFSTDASYLYNGTAAQSTGAGLPSQVRNLATTNANAVTLAAPTSVAQVLTVGGAGNLVLNGNALTLLSSASGTALVVNASTGVVSGATAVVQRYIDPSLNTGLGYRHYSSPVGGSTVADLATAGFAPEISQASAYNSSATPGTTTPFPTVFAYDQGRVASAVNNYSAFDKGFVAPLSLSTTLTQGKGYVVNLKGDQVVDFVGTLTTGTGSFTLTRNASTDTNAADAGWQLMGNPYPAPLDYSTVATADRPNLDAAIYVYQSTGQYVGQYRAYVNNQGGNPVLPVGQGFFVRVSAGQTSGSLTFRNNQRLTTANATTFQRTTADTRPQVQLDLRGATGAADALYAYAEAGATPAADAQYDAVKLPNSTGLNLASLASSGESLAIDGQAAFTAATVLPLTVGVPAAGTYTLSAAALSNLPAGLDAYLADAQTGQTLKLTTGTSYAFQVTAAEATALLSGRFQLRFRSATALATVASLTPEAVGVYPNPAHERFTITLPGVVQATTVRAELLNSLGQVVRRQSAALPLSGTQLTLDAANLGTGIYTLRLQAGTTTLAKRIVIQ